MSTPPPRPRWALLYGALAVGAVAGLLTHAAVHDPPLGTIIDAGFSVLLFAVLVGWVRWNRLALSQLDVPDPGAGRLEIRIVRSRTQRPVPDRSAPRDDERVIVPYDFR